MSSAQSFLEHQMIARRSLGIRPGLKRIFSVLSHLPSPERAIGRPVLIAGTNGKGSTAAFMEAVLMAAGKSTALFTSPHLVNITERLRINGRQVDIALLDAAAQRVCAAEQAAGVRLTGFELLTTAALLPIAEASPDYALLEIGMGGRFDAANVVEPELTVITPLGIDHTRFLGATAVSIAREKFGVTKPGVTCVSAKQSPDVLEDLLSHCSAQDTPLLLEGPDFSSSGTPENFSYQGTAVQMHSVCLGLAGRYQVQNAAVALAACEHLLEDEPALEDAFFTGLQAARWPGRFDLRTVRGKPVLFDGCHNVQAAEAMVCAFSGRWSHRPAILFAAREDKDVAGMLRVLSPLASRFIFTVPGKAPGHSPEFLASLVDKPADVAQDPRQALRLLTEACGNETDLCCGSLYLVGYYLEGLFDEPARK